MAEEKLQAYVVTCTDLHKAVGPMDLATAVKVSKKLSVEPGESCHFLPVPLEGVTVVKVSGTEEPKDQRGPAGHPGQYL
jgi:hypothetical protein